MDVNDRSELKNFIVRNTIGRLVQSITATTDNTYYLDSLGIITKFLTNNKVSKYTIRLKALEEEIKYIENTISDLSKKIIG
jgi:hypothetical protein